MYCAMRGHFLGDMNAISTCRSLSPFARYTKMRNGGGITFGTIPDTPHPRKSNDGRDRKASSSPIIMVCGAASHRTVAAPDRSAGNRVQIAVSEQY
jgi:hypothetical protein